MVLFTLATHARTPKEFTLERSSISMVAEGIQFKPFNDMKAEQITPLRSRVLTRGSGSSQERLTAYDFDELWNRGQKVATYFNSKVKVSTTK